MDHNTKYSDLINTLIATNQKEKRYLEFKSNYQDPEKIGKYLSALSCGACLDNQDYGYLVFGVDDSTLEIVGTTFDASKEKFKGDQPLELALRQYINPKINFQIIEFHYYDKQRIVIFEIPAAKAEPTTFQNIAYVRVDSCLTELKTYPDWTRQLYNSRSDWTAHIIEEATIEHLDTEAINKARKGFIEKNPQLASQIESWDDITFLNKARLTIEGKITRACLLLLGKTESTHFLLPHSAQIVWKLTTNNEQANELFNIPFLLNTTRLLQRIRNYKVKIFPNNQLIPAEVWKYDTEVILEGLHNCIAHQDYDTYSRIIVTETTDELILFNMGSFFDGKAEDYINGTKTPSQYRNPFLVNAMVALKMIDSLGYGIHKMYRRQKERYFPMPDYDHSPTDRVILYIPGHIIDPNYSQLLMQETEINLDTAVLLDKVQKKKYINDIAIKYLRSKKLIEGRKPSLYVSREIAEITDKKAEYIQNKGISDNQCKLMIKNYLNTYQSATREDIKKLIIDLLPRILTEKQKEDKIKNILQSLKRDNQIYNAGQSTRKAVWKLVIV